ncbi:2-oxo-4-hydroxy-4-carboxy-5-ureidoimidazoline decarboxylase [Microbulbifer bruguierae]|uniref:2-oxo-4-hydroxy-4-carboxy-5-ureidoimidazoline decarboxylase n=1 Tax=Microbulbifer bruguierae TaxID=3029061 RepID=A0ABY8N8E9_9GAMM|nr:2-oxo-4-hydroxy-4-carboxy-5-ureidoimidazoline decarboxylase [Microbulbifer bruguierae]WGL15171.1 2-oxo-4-hydroxy-4-carboxy-5-ureidoimidazoline decarboxylase [Microbulbifer bruguierae]
MDTTLMKDGLQFFNTSSPAQAQQMLLQCCTSRAWVRKMLDGRPFASLSQLLAAADDSWGTLEEADYLEAFAGHPKIGDMASLQKKYAASKALAAGEQAGMDDADDAVIAALARGNRDYEQKFGFIFIVCATGKSAAQMLALLQARLPNSRTQELRIAAEEQRKIFHLRLEKLL